MRLIVFSLAFALLVPAVSAGSVSQPEIQGDQHDAMDPVTDLWEGWVDEYGGQFNITLQLGDGSHFSNESSPDGSTPPVDPTQYEWGFHFRALNSDWMLKWTDAAVAKPTGFLLRDGVAVNASLEYNPFSLPSPCIPDMAGGCIKADPGYYQHVFLSTAWTHYTDFLPAGTVLSDFYADSLSHTDPLHQNTVACRGLTVIDCAPDSGTSSAQYTIQGEGIRPLLQGVAVAMQSPVTIAGPGQVAQGIVHIKNNSPQHMALLVAPHAPATWRGTASPSQVHLNPGEAADATVNVTISKDATPGDTLVPVEVSDGTAVTAANWTVRIPADPSKLPHFQLGAAALQLTLAAGSTGTSRIILQNQGAQADTYRPSLSGGAAAWVQVSPNTLLVPAGGSGSISLNATVPPTTGAGNYTARIVIASDLNPSVTQQTTLTLQVTTAPAAAPRKTPGIELPMAATLLGLSALAARRRKTA